MELNIVPRDLLDDVSAAIERYQLLEPRERVLVAVSGGKDSLLLARALAELGYEAKLVAVDMGYEDSWNTRVSTAAEEIGLHLAVIDVRSTAFQTAIGQKHQEYLNSQLSALDMISADAELTATPCTHCYNTKAVALSIAADAMRIRRVAFGHHATDAITSLLKSGLMYIDRWDIGHARFDRKNFSALIDNAIEQVDEHSKTRCGIPILARVRELVETGFAGTDEPPRQAPLAFDDGQEIIRPLFRIGEMRIIQFRTEVEWRTEGSGCGHGATRDTQTPREMIQHRLLRRLEDSAVGAQVVADLFKAVEERLAPDGSNFISARKRRADILGNSYKPALRYESKL